MSDTPLYSDGPDRKTMAEGDRSPSGTLTCDDDPGPVAVGSLDEPGVPSEMPAGSADLLAAHAEEPKQEQPASGGDRMVACSEDPYRPQITSNGDLVAAPPGDEHLQAGANNSEHGVENFAEAEAEEDEDTEPRLKVVPPQEASSVETAETSSPAVEDSESAQDPVETDVTSPVDTHASFAFDVVAARAGSDDAGEPAREKAGSMAGKPDDAGVRGTGKRRWRPRTRRQRVISLVLLGVLLLGILVPGAIAIGFGVNAYMTYTALRTQASEGVQHLLTIKTIFTGAKAHPTGFLDINKLHRSQGELSAARKDFQQVQFTLEHSDLIHTVSNDFSQFRPQIASARVASQMGIDAIDIGQKLISTALVLAPSFRGPLLTNSQKPLVTQPMLDLVGKTIDNILPLLNDIQAQSRHLSINALPVSAQNRAQLAQFLPLIPQTISDLTQARALLGSAGWLLGVNDPRTFLVQTMDRAELRPTGGFTGQYGELQINAGRVGSFSLKDISFVEYVDNSPTQGQMAPPQYRSWWPFANWGLRDSNLSADFPTSAQIAIAQYKHEVGHQVDGVILFTPFFIEHILDAIGPIPMPGYNDTITSQNLEDRLHYYQQDNSGIRKQEIVQHVDPPAQARKLFTSLLAHTLMDRVRHAPPDELLAIAQEALHDLKTKDLQVYVNNSQAEGLLMQYGDAAVMDRSTTHDGVYVVQANINATKASQYVRTIMHDTVTLDPAGGATHLMQLRLASTETGPTYGYDTYRDYVRIYVPTTSKLLWGDGFDTGTPLCGAGWGTCPLTGVYPRDELLCPPGQFQPGAASPMLTNENGGLWHPLDTVGPPTNTTSDEPGRAMFGGWVIVPKNCTMTVTLSWYVPPVQGQPYALLVQRQAGAFPELDLTVLPTLKACATLKTPGLHFDDLMTEDMFFKLPALPSSHSANAACYPQLPV